MWLMILFITTISHYYDATPMYFGESHMAVDVNRDAKLQEFTSKENCEYALNLIYEETKIKGVCVQK